MASHNLLEKRKQLALLAETIHQMPPNKQEYWSGHLNKLIETDESPEMRRLVVRAAGRLNDSTSSISLIEKGLDDSSEKVRMEACQALGRRQQVPETMVRSAGMISQKVTMQTGLTRL